MATDQVSAPQDGNTRAGASSPNRINEVIQTHYAGSDTASALLSALEKAGKDLNHLTLEDLAPVDEFHIRGRTATLELARARKLRAKGESVDHVLEMLARGLTHKMLHGTMAELHSVDGAEREHLAQTVSRLFLRGSSRTPGGDAR